MVSTFGSEMDAARRDALPPRLLPILYFAGAHVSLALAFAAVAFEPRAVAGFFYHARMVAIVHLVTLGWISSSILGAVYIVGPLALRMPMPARKLDYWAYGFTTVGIAGMVSHFWIGQFSGMAWSAAMVGLGFTHVAIRVLRGLPAASIQRPVKMHLALAFLNALGAATMGILLGFDKVFHFLPGFVLSNVFGHAHLAAIGWASMMVVGVAYRMLPMVLPAAMPQGRSVYGSVVLLEIGAVGLFVGLLVRSAWVPAFALSTIAGFAAFFAHVGWMKRHPRPAPVGLARPDYGVRHAMLAIMYLTLAAIVGMILAVSPRSDWMLRAALAYGVFGLVGFLAQMVVGMEGRILPMFAWYWAFANTGFTGPAPSPHEMPERFFQKQTFYLWLAGVPALAGGFFFNAVPLLAAGAWSLLAAVVLNGLNTSLVLRHAFARKPARPVTPAANSMAAIDVTAERRSSWFKLASMCQKIRRLEPKRSLCA